MDVLFRFPRKEEFETLVQLGENTGIFGPGEAQELLGQTLINLSEKTLPLKHQAQVLIHNTAIKGWVYFGPTEDPLTWNLWWIGVDPNFKGQGYGKKLLEFVEQTVKSEGALYLIIETSSASSFNHTRDFYKRQGYNVSSTEPEAYRPGEDKIIFKKKLL